MPNLHHKPFSWSRMVVHDHRPVLRLEAAGRRWDVRFVGMLSRTRFLVSHPMDGGRLVFVKEGEAFEVANFDGVVLSAFESRVLRVVLGESPGLELSLPPPERRRRGTVRTARRVAVTVPCSVRYGSDAGALRAGFTGDLSVQGAQVAIEQPLPPGTERVDLSMRVAVLGEPVTLAVMGARVCSVAPDPRPGVVATLLGLQFGPIERPMQLALALFVAEHTLAESDDVFGAIR